jgi:hypothetical protein
MAGLVVAWEKMKLASCISRAVETNLRLALDPSSGTALGPVRTASVRRIHQRIREITPAR